MTQVIPFRSFNLQNFFCCHCLSISNLEEPSASSLSPPSLASRCAKAALAKSCASSRKKRTTPTFHLNCWKSHCHYLSANHNLLNGKYVKRGNPTKPSILRHSIRNSPRLQPWQQLLPQHGRARVWTWLRAVVLGESWLRLAEVQHFLHPFCFFASSSSATSLA